MKKDNLIIKWLDNSLSEKELQAFKKLDAFSDLTKIDQAAQKYKAPEFDVDSNFQSLLAARASHSSKSTTSWKRYISGIAAAAVVAIGLYFTLLHNPSEMIMAHNGEHIQYTLPDNSSVLLNAGSSITINENNWDSNRKLQLKGEAFFKVAKGQKFTVETALGTVQVLGTEFTVNSRASFFEVVCYEGSVEILLNAKKTKITAGNSFKYYGEKIVKETTELTFPLWSKNKSQFKSVPFIYAVEELERQYDIEIQFDTKHAQTQFTGTFTHENLNTALEAITIPLNLSFDISGKNVVLKSN